MEELQNKKASLSGSLTKSKEELASSETSAAETAKVISSLCQSCDWLLQNFDTRRTAQNDETVGILKQSKDEKSAYLTAFKKKEWKTNHEGLMKTEIQPRSARPPPARGKLRIEGKSVDADEKNTDGKKGPDEDFDTGESMLWLAPSYLGAQGCNPRRCDEFYAPLQQSWKSSKHNTRSITQMMQKC